MSFVDRWAEHWRSLSDRPAVRAEIGETSFGDLAGLVAETELVLSEVGVGPGDIVVAPAEFSARAVALLFALARCGAVVVPYGDTLNDQLVCERLAEVGPVRVLKWSARDRLEGRSVEGGGALEGPVGQLRGAGRAGLILFTGGSTGAAKAVVHDLELFLGSFVLRRGEERRLLPLMACDHLGGLDMLLRAMATGTTVVDPGSRGVAEVCRLIERHRPQIVAGTPGFLNLLALAAAAEPCGIRGFEAVNTLVYGADQATAGTRRRFSRAFPNAIVVSRFGTTETGAVKLRYDVSVGCFKVSEDTNYIQVRDGELWIRLPGSFVGILGNGRESMAIRDGWYNTGDRAAADPDGGLRILGRTGNMINVAGEKVLPERVEDVVSRHPKVGWCRAYGEPHALMGEVVALDVVWTGQVLAPLAVKREIEAFVEGKLSRWEKPVRVRSVERGELTAAGKVRRR